MKPKVSVIIPVYNAEKYLRECLDSVVNQTLKEIEIICVDDDSPDNSKSIVEEYVAKDSRVQLIRQKNSGAAAARNRGMAVAEGKYIYFIDSDDYIVPQALSVLYSKAEQYDTDIILFGGDTVFDARREKLPFERFKNYYIQKQTYRRPVSGYTMFENQIYSHRFRPNITMQFFNMEFLKKTGIKFCDGLNFEDELFSLQIMLAAKRVFCIEECLYMRRVRAGSLMTGDATARQVDSLFYIYVWTVEKVSEKEYPSGVTEALKLFAKRRYSQALEIYSLLSVAEKEKNRQQSGDGIQRICRKNGLFSNSSVYIQR